MTSSRWALWEPLEVFRSGNFAAASVEFELRLGGAVRGRTLAMPGVIRDEPITPGVQFCRRMADHT